MHEAQLVERAKRGEHLDRPSLLELERISPSTYSQYLRRESAQRFQRPEPRVGAQYGKMPKWIGLALRKEPRRFTALAVAVALSTYANSRTRQAWPSLETLAEDVGTSTRAVSNAIRTLERVGFLSIKRRRRQSNLYTVYLDSPAAVKSRGAFDAMISRLNLPQSNSLDSPPGFTQTEKRTENLQQSLTRRDDEVEGVL